MTEASVPSGDGGGGAGTGATEAAVAPRPATPLWLAVTIAAIFGVLYAYDVWEAVRDLVGVSLMVGDLGVSLAGIGIALLIAALLVPILVYALAFWLGYRRDPLAQVVLFLAGYAVVQALTLDLGSFFELGGIDFS
ncbi:hypothetical protein [Agromyces bauzanensis]